VSFAAPFHSWLREQHGNEELARQLRALSEPAWDAGDPWDRDALMRFIYLRKESSLFHYLFDQLGSEDRYLGVAAIGYIAALVMGGYRFNRADHATIAAFGAKYPDQAVASLVEWVLGLLEESDSGDVDAEG
jgi:hypothetical protein